MRAIVKQRSLSATLSREQFDPRAFTPGRIAVLNCWLRKPHLAENARLYPICNAEAFLAEGRASARPEASLECSERRNLLVGGNLQIFEHDRAAKPTLEWYCSDFIPTTGISCSNPRPRPGKDNFDFEHRLLMPDGRVQHIHVILTLAEFISNLEFVGP